VTSAPILLARAWERLRSVPAVTHQEATSSHDERFLPRTLDGLSNGCDSTYRHGRRSSPRRRRLRYLDELMFDRDVGWRAGDGVNRRFGA
jgi:hypothetical protein